MIGPNPPTGLATEMTQPSGLDISAAKPADVALILSLINELAEYEKLRHESVATEASIDKALFGPKPRAEALIARFDGEPAGFALFFHNFSTFLGKPGLYLEDLFVRPAYRGRAIGKSLLSHLAGVALERDCGRFQWQVLDWNRPSRDFYESLGAEPDAAWVNYRISGDALRRLAAARNS
jgi:GNAT superfamily N-acetyltransferase